MKHIILVLTLLLFVCVCSSCVHSDNTETAVVTDTPQNTYGEGSTTVVSTDIETKWRTEIEYISNTGSQPLGDTTLTTKNIQSSTENVAATQRPYSTVSNSFADGIELPDDIW